MAELNWFKERINSCPDHGIKHAWSKMYQTPADLNSLKVILAEEADYLVLKMYGVVVRNKTITDLYCSMAHYMISC